MKTAILFSATCFVGCALSHAMDANVIDARGIDPQTMDPKKLAVLEVLKTAIPTSSNAPMPTDGNTPGWYANLPADVKSVLPSMYPAASSPATAAAISTHAVTSSPAPSSSSSTPPSTPAAHTDAVSLSSIEFIFASTFSTFSSSRVSPSSTPCKSSPSPPPPPPSPCSTSSSASAAKATTTVHPLNTTLPYVTVSTTSYFTVTKTLQRAFASTGFPVPSANSSRLSNGTLSKQTPVASPSGLFSAAGKTADVVQVEKMAVLGWAVLGAGFFLFA